jgi:probable phosphoglycerate mutase
MLLILARHGNTFGPEDTPVWVGANEDLPLVETGLEQSRAIGRAIRDGGITLDRVIAGPLKRTRTGARLAAETCGFTTEVEIDDRLKEIDYGVWGGKPDSEIEESWGRDAIENWRERSIVPEGAGWSPSPGTLRENVKAVLASVTGDLSPDTAVLIVTSNGILRYFHERLAGEEAASADAKVKTGHLCAVRIEPGRIDLLAWNRAPGDIIPILKDAA